MADDVDVTRRFARQTLHIGNEALAETDRAQLHRLILDCFGVSKFSASESWMMPIKKGIQRFNGTGRSPVIGTNLLVAPAIAALVNGTAAHGCELDDTHEASMSHPGSVVIPAALAVAAEVDASHDATLQAIAAGYEAMTRIGVASNAAMVVHEGFHPTALFGVFGAATAAAILMNLDKPALLRAWGHALSLAGGSMQFSDETRGTTVKRLHAGFAARNGIMAADLAAMGVEAPSRALDGKYGFLKMFARHATPEHLDIPASAALQIHQTSFKPYACCRLFHALIDALRQVTDGFNLPLEAISQIYVRAPTVVFEQHMMRRPTSTMAAQYSLPFAVGASLVYGPERVDAYAEDKLDDARILSIADRVDGQPDANIEAHFPKQMGAGVDLTLANGTRRTDVVMDCKGTAANPMSDGDLDAKIAGLVRGIIPTFKPSDIRSALSAGAGGRALAGMFAAPSMAAPR